MKKERVFPGAALLWLIIPPLLTASGQRDLPNIKQVRVIAERVSVYIEPSRGSTRIDIVAKGALLNLLQTKKVKDIWFYVSYSSPRYGTRVSGFVLDSAVELVGEAVPSVPEEKKPQEKTVTPPPVPPLKPRTEAKKETKPEPLPAPKIEESQLVTSLPEVKRIEFPRQMSPLQERVWEPLEKTPPQMKPIEAEPKHQEPPQISESLVLTGLPKGRGYAFPLKAPAILDTAWKVEEEAPAPKPAPKKKAVAPGPNEKPARPQVIRPPRPTMPRKGTGGISFGLGYGSSFGGAGASLQLSTGSGIALHAGAGVFPTTLVYSDTDWVKNETLWSVGVKYYLPIQSPLFYPYVDVQYGGLRVEAAQVIIGIWEYDYVYSREQKSLWGPSLLAGLELRMGRLGICAALGISYVTTSWDFLENKVALSFDTGLVVHF